MPAPSRKFKRRSVSRLPPGLTVDSQKGDISWIPTVATLPGGTESLGTCINNAGQVIGFSTVSTASDPIGFIGFPTHTFIWQNGTMLDIRTLVGNDSVPGAS